MGRQAETAEIISGRIPSLDDGQLVERARSGEPWAQEALFRRFAPSVHGTVVRLLGSRQDAEDVVQETFVTALVELPRLRNPKAVRPWLIQIAVRKTHRSFRKRKMLAALGLDRTVEDATLDLLAAPGAAPDEIAELGLISQALKRLPVKERIAWMLRFVEGETLPEVARLCDCSLATAKRRVASAKNRLDRHLEGADD